METFKRETQIWNPDILSIVPALSYINLNDKVLHLLGRLSQKSKLSILFHKKKIIKCFSGLWVVMENWRIFNI